MKVNCVHGYFIFEESKEGQISDYMALTGFTIAKLGDIFTFEELLAVPSFSLKGVSFMGSPATENFEGKPWEVFEENGVVYDFTDGLVKPILSVTLQTEIYQAGNVFVSQGLLLPGSLTSRGRIKGFQGWFSRQRQTWIYSEVDYV